MNWLRTVATKFLGLFVDDVWLSGGILVWVLVAGLAFARLLPTGWDGIVFFIGIAGFVTAAALRSAGSK